MSKWLMSVIVMAAIGCARTSATAQPAEAPPAEPAQPAQPRAQAPRAADERAAALADRERARAEAAVIRAQAAAEGAGARARVRVAMGAQVKKEKAAWLGLSTDRVPAALRQHLQMKTRGVGLIIERVEPKSPADEAGLEQYDILEKLDDQWLVNTEQFSVLIRMHKPGDEIALSVIRQGQPQQIKAKLGEKELPVLGLGGSVWYGEAPAAGVFNLGDTGDMKVFMRQVGDDDDDETPATAPSGK